MEHIEYFEYIAYIEQIAAVLYLTTGEKEKLSAFCESANLTENFKDEIIDHLVENIWKKKKYEQPRI